jgi:hypothetical protein
MSQVLWKRDWVKLAKKKAESARRPSLSMKFTENYKGKHEKDAKFGWYRYYAKFALPVFDDNGEIERYNVFNVVMVVRHNQDGKLYLYDIMNIKKKRAPFSSPKTLLSKKPISCP